MARNGINKDVQVNVGTETVKVINILGFCPYAIHWQRTVVQEPVGSEIKLTERQA